MTGYVQVGLVAINTFQIAHLHYLGAIFVGYGISIIWTMNVRSVAFGNRLERHVYSAAAALGTLTGMALPQLFY